MMQEKVITCVLSTKLVRRQDNCLAIRKVLKNKTKK